MLVSAGLMTPDPKEAARPELEAAHAKIPTLEEKVRFLSQPSAYPGVTSSVVSQETHMSWVFLTQDRAFKLKKPVRYPYLDFRSLDARERYCREEIRLNSRLARGIYLGVRPLKVTQSDVLTLEEDGRVVDWLVEMRRLPADRMLDVLLTTGRLKEQDVERLANVLATFYRNADHPSVEPEKPFLHFVDELAEDRAVLLRSGLPSDSSGVSRLLDRIERALLEVREPLRSRARTGHIVEGHGDLRPEHVCLTDPVVIFDCLEFNRDLRLLDPFDELAFLGMECARLGAPWFGPALLSRVENRLGDCVPDRLIAVYTALHAALRARLSLAHLLDPSPREPWKWAPLAQHYLALADEALAATP